ncbi:hypothetical protein MKX03_015543 [Papaver bracteatum]|nr:hypothetical protein MKX03_015543 [Papaver bracteatum]
MKTSRINHPFAALICISAFTEIVSAWQSVCAPGVDYIERNYHPIPGDKCGSFPTWCTNECKSIGLFMVQNDCRLVGADMDCQCCCAKEGPIGPAPPPSAPPFTADSGKTHDVYCPWNPQCESKCKEVVRSSASSECWGSSRDFVGGSFTWYEQCCCGDVLPDSV